jgi:hypothetical protein
MALPLVLPLLLSTAKVAAVAITAKLAVWSSTRFTQHGFDVAATKKQLLQDITAGKIVARDAASLLASLRQLATATSIDTVCKAAANITAALSHLPPQTRAGLDNSVDLSNRINEMLRSALLRAHVEIPEAADRQLLGILTQRHYKNTRT